MLHEQVTVLRDGMDPTCTVNCDCGYTANWIGWGALNRSFSLCVLKLCMIWQRKACWGVMPEKNSAVCLFL